MNIKVFFQTPKHYSHLRRMQFYVMQVIVFGVLVWGPANICAVQQYSCIVPVSLQKKTSRHYLDAKCYLDSTREPLEFNRWVNTIIFISYMCKMLIIFDVQRKSGHKPHAYTMGGA